MARRLFPGPLSPEQVRLIQDAALARRSQAQDDLEKQRWDIIIHAMARALEHRGKKSEKEVT